MKPNVSKSGGRFQAGALSLLAGLILCPLAGMATDATYLNNGTIIYLGSGAFGNTVAFPPNVDATNFINGGTMEIVAFPTPFMTAHTLNFTNTGEMLGTVGWEFDYGPLSSGSRGMAANFYNGNLGTIESFSSFLPNPLISPFTSLEGFLWVSATNLVNKGMLAADAACEIKLTGVNVDLSRGSVEISPIGNGSGTINNFPTNGEYYPDIAIYDEYWAQTNRNNLESDAIWDGTTAILPPFVPFAVTEPCALAGSAMLFASNTPPSVIDSVSYPAGFLSLTVTNMNPTNASLFIVSTVLVPTNIIYQAAFVKITDPNITGQIGFTPSTAPSNSFQTVSVKLLSTSGDELFLVDTLASATGRGLLKNYIVSPAAACSSATFRPTNYMVGRVLGDLGSPGAGVPAADFFYQTGWSNRAVYADYAAYSCFVDDQATEPPSNPGNPNSNASSVTNLSGRIHISATNLNLFDTELRGGGEIVVQAGNLVSSQNASVDCENLSYNLGSTNGYLNVTNLASTSVVRFRGTVSECSAVWSNTTSVVTPNYLVTYDTNVVPPSITFTNAFITNTVQIGLYALVVDASQLSSKAPVTVYDLLLHSTNIVISDSMNVVESFLLDGRNFTLNGSLTFPGTAPTNPISMTPFSGNPIQDWVYTVAPTLLYFTNNGSLDIANNAHFGDDGPTNYLAFVNNGTIIAGNQTIDSVNLQINNGTNESLVAGFTATAVTAVLSNATISARGDIDITAGTLLIDPSTLTANGALNFTVTNLSDAGAGSGNVFSCNNGFNSWVKPGTGDLLGTTFQTTAAARVSVTHTWAGQDFGTNVAGFLNNAAIGSLVFVAGGDGTSHQEPQFVFSGTGASNGLYVAYLDISRLGNYNNKFLDGSLVNINPNLTIYFASASTNPTNLDGQFGGHLRWVPGAAAVLLSRSTALSASSYNSGNGKFQFSVASQSGQTNIIQASTNLVTGPWIPLYTNPGPFIFTDPKATNYPYRFYRVRIGP